MWVDYMVLVANIAGLVGSGCLLVPFFGEQGLRKLYRDLRAAPAGSRGLADLFSEAARQTRERLAEFRPSDLRWVIAGLAGLAVSYLLNILVWFAGKGGTGAP